MVYVMIASGLILVLGVARIFNFAHGEFYMLGAFATFALCQVLHINFYLSVVIAIGVVALFAIFCYRFIFHYIRGNLLLCAAASIGLSMIIERGPLSVSGPRRGAPLPDNGFNGHWDRQLSHGEDSCNTRVNCSHDWTLTTFSWQRNWEKQ